MEPQFSAFTPRPARKAVLEMLNGDEESLPSNCLQVRLGESQKILDKIAKEIEAEKKISATEPLDKLYQLQRKATRVRDGYKRQVDFLYRLAKDERMKDAYSKLNDVITCYDEWYFFIAAVTSSLTDYAEVRDNLKAVKKRADDISKHCEKLAELLEDQTDTLELHPLEALSIRHLLRTTDSRLHLETWEKRRDDLLGVINLVTDENYDQRKVALDRQEDWKAAPSIPELIRTLKEESQKESRRASHFYRTVTHSRKSNKKFDYLRNIVIKIFHTRDLQESPEIKHAIVITASVAFEQPIDISYDDVDAAIKRTPPFDRHLWGEH
ncbi:MAG: hypothetical protein P8L39_09250 [Halioglobus sp.]|nr:hypothetical protein [Halioglobus sp.]